MSQIKYVLLAPTGRIAKVRYSAEDIDEGWTEADESINELSGDLRDYKYIDGKFVYDPRDEAIKLALDAMDEALETLLDLQIRTSTLELTAE